MTSPYHVDDSQFLLHEKQGGENRPVSRIMTYAPSVIVGVLLFSISTLSSLYRLNFAWEKVDWGKLAVTVVIQMVMVFCAKWIGADLRYQKAQNLPIIQRPKEIYLGMQEGVDLASFDSWIIGENQKRKVRAYIAYQQSKIDRLSKMLAKCQYLDEVEGKGKREKKMRLLTARIDLLKASLTEEYIKQNISHIKVKYCVLYTADFISQSESTSEGERYHMMESLEHGKQIVRTLPLTMFLTVLFAAVSFSPEFGSFEPVSMLMDLFNIALNFTLGWTVVGQNSINTLVQVYINRAKVLARYKQMTADTVAE